MKTWLITGCSSGLGKGLAEAVLEHGDQAVVTARRPETLRDFTGTALALPLDVSDDAQAEAAVKAALARFSRVDVLASVAGYCLRGAVEECSMDEIHRQFETNFFGTVRMIRKVLPSGVMYIWIRIRTENFQNMSFIMKGKNLLRMEAGRMLPVNCQDFIRD